VAEAGGYPRSVMESDTGDILVAVWKDSIIGIIHIEEVSTPPYPSVRPHRYACIIGFCFVM